MAAPITHIVLTEAVYTTHFSHLDKVKFFVGTCLPDIRYLGIIDRDKTHFRNLSLDSIKSEDSFIAGVKFHSFLDEIRESFVIENDIYSEMPESPYVTQALKFLEDMSLYEKVTDWSTYIGYLSMVTEEYSVFSITAADAKKWNGALTNYFSKKPTFDSVLQFVADIGKPSTMGHEINKIVSELSSSAKLLRYVENLYSNFGNLL